VSPALRTAGLFAAQFCAFGLLLPFLPAVLTARGLTFEEVGLVLAAGSAIRLMAGPLGGRIADASGRPRLVLALAALGAGLAATGLFLASGLVAVLAVMLLHNAALAPIVPLSDTLAVAAARAASFDYARVRAAGSIAFILAALAGGQALALVGPDAVVALLVACLLAAAAAAILAPASAASAPAPGGGFLRLLRIPALRRLMLVSALIQGSHALYYAFGTLHWQAAGLSAGLIGLLWAAGVLAEVALFWWGRGLVTRLGPAGLCAAAAGMGVLRWCVLAATTDAAPLILAQLLHAGTFAMQHLATVQLLARIAPAGQAGSAQSLHAAIGVGLPIMLVTLAAGPLYAATGGAAFLAMAALCALAWPLSFGLR
jgi:PPP family 3-phenylpropionic acid transporter